MSMVQRIQEVLKVLQEFERQKIDVISVILDYFSSSAKIHIRRDFDESVFSGKAAKVSKLGEFNQYTVALNDNVTVFWLVPDPANVSVKEVTL